MINKKRLIITSIISILLVSTLFLGSTYSIFTSQDIDEEFHVYKTGNLDVTYTLSESNIIINNNFLVAEKDAYRVKPYRITITNTGNVAYQFDLILTNTKDSNTINYQYIKTKVGKLESKRLSDGTNNIIKEDVILLPGKSVDIDVRVWVSNDIANSEIGKTFSAKLSVDGLAVYNDNPEIDNSMLASPLIYLNSVEAGKYVKYSGNNGCDNTTEVNGLTACSGKNANASSTSNGYCSNSSYPFDSNGWMLAYVEDGSAHLVSAGATDCMCTSSNGESSSSSCSGNLSSSNLYKHFDNMNNIALKYCNKAYAKGGICNNTTARVMNASDFERITGEVLSSSLCFNMSSDACGKNKPLIDNNGYYWLATPYSASSEGTFYWNPSTSRVNNNSSSNLYGVRPVLALESSIIVTGGEGTEDDPYIISNPLTAPVYLNTVEPGSYVKYTGNNGCDDTTKVNGLTACSGKNANASSTSNGYCYSSSSSFGSNGWRLAYVEDGSAHLVSAGATDCMCTSSNGESSSSSCSGNLSSSNLYKHFDNMNNIALKYCNKAYAKGGICNNTTARAMNASDFERITGKVLSSSSCFTSSEACGKNNPLIDNNGYYWLATPFSASSNYAFDWNPSGHLVNYYRSNNVSGVRPVLALESSIIVTGGSGTEEDPYTISNKKEDAVYLNTAAVGSYVKYVGDSKNGCDDTNAVNGWTSCGGKNANYVSDSNKGYCQNSTYKFTVNGWRIGYIEDGSVHLISAGATDCMCTSSDGTISGSSCSSGLSTADYYKQIDNLDNLALKYCNKDYVKGGICNNTTTWAMDDLDFQKIMNRSTLDACYSVSNAACGIGNDLIDNGSYYHLAEQKETIATNYMWNPYSPANIYHSYGSNNFIAGMRPVISLASTVRIIGGTGTYTDPYLIAN